MEIPTKHHLTLAKMKWANIQADRKVREFKAKNNRNMNTVRMRIRRAQENGDAFLAELRLTPDEAAELKRLEAEISAETEHKQAGHRFKPKSMEEKLRAFGAVEVTPNMPAVSVNILPSDAVEVKAVGSQQQGNTGVEHTLEDSLDTWRSMVNGIGYIPEAEFIKLTDEQVDYIYQDRIDRLPFQRGYEKRLEYSDQSVVKPVSSSEGLDNDVPEDESIESILARTAGCEG